jgi:hypothetical protein
VTNTRVNIASKVLGHDVDAEGVGEVRVEAIVKSPAPPCSAPRVPGQSGRHSGVPCENDLVWNSLGKLRAEIENCNRINDLWSVGIRLEGDT